MSATATLAPTRANANAVARPIPLPAPVTKATLPAYDSFFCIDVTPRCVVASPIEMFGEKGRELVEGDKLHPVVKVNVAGLGNDDQFLWLTGKPLSLFTE